MTFFYKVSVVFLLMTFSVEGKISKNERILPIEIVLNSKNNGKGTIPESSILKNKAIELKIRSDESGNGGKVDLIIAATKEVQAIEKKVDRYSPAFNAERDLFNNESPRDLKSIATLDRNWDTSRQDSSFLYPSQSAETFPFLMLRQILQTPQPLMLERNQFSPLQNLRHYEENLQRQLMPHINQGIGPVNNMPVGVALSQPYFTGGISPDITQHRLLNSPQILNMLQNGLLQPDQQYNQNLPLSIPQQFPSAQNPPSNRYSLFNGTPLKLNPHQNQNFLQNNDLSDHLNRPLNQYSERQRMQQPLKQHNHVSQSIPDILAPNKQSLPIHSRPEYTLDRNIQNINTPHPKNTHQNILSPQQRNILQNFPKPLDNGIQNFQQNQRVQSYQPVISNQPRQNLYNSPQQPLNHHHEQFPPIQAVKDSIRNDQPVYRQQNLPNYNHNPNQSSQERYRPSIGEYNSQSLNQPNLFNSAHQIHPQLPSSNNFKNPDFGNGQLSGLPGDDRKIPVYHHSPEGARPTLNPLQSSVSTYPQRLPGLTQVQNQHSPVEPVYSNRQVYPEQTYGSQSQNAAHGRGEDFSRQSGEAYHTDSDRLSKYKESNDSSTPTKRRKLRNKKRSQAKGEPKDLEGHSSHQYIIKLG